MTNILDKFDQLAKGYSEHDYADPERYAERRARVVVERGPRLGPGDSILDLCCGDGIMAAPFAAYGLRYQGVDASAGMIAAARERNPGVSFEAGRSEEYEPAEPVDATVCLRAFYYAPDRRAFFTRVASYTRRKFVFDFQPSEFDPAEITRDLRAAGFGTIDLYPFFLPQLRHLPGIVLPAIYAFEKTGRLASFAARNHGTVFCVAQP